MASLVNRTKYLKNNKYQFLTNSSKKQKMKEYFPIYCVSITLIPKSDKRHHRKLETSSFCKHTHTHKNLQQNTSKSNSPKKKTAQNHNPQPTTHNPNNARLVNYMKINQHNTSYQWQTDKNHTIILIDVGKDLTKSNIFMMKTFNKLAVEGNS